jgi:hypothetical protein
MRGLLEEHGLRLAAATVVLLSLLEGAIDVLAVVVVLDLLDLGEGSVGYLNAAWGVGALVSGAFLAVLLERGRLAAALALGCVVTGAATALPAAWPVALAAFAGWFGVGVGYNFAEVAARTLLQRLGSDEVLGRILGSLETVRLAALALGSIAAPAAIALLGIRGALLAFAAILPLFALLRWAQLRRLETGAPVPERPYALLRGDPIFAPLPVALVERLSRNLVAVSASPRDEIITEGDHGDRFYLIDSGEVEVFERGERCRVQAEGESFGEIALLRDVPRTATVRALGQVELLSLGREHFIAAVTGHHRSRQAADATIDERWQGPTTEPLAGRKP